MFLYKYLFACLEVDKILKKHMNYLYNHEYKIVTKNALHSIQKCRQHK